MSRADTGQGKIPFAFPSAAAYLTRKERGGIGWSPFDSGKDQAFGIKGRIGNDGGEKTEPALKERDTEQIALAEKGPDYYFFRTDASKSVAQGEALSRGRRTAQPLALDGVPAAAIIASGLEEEDTR